MIIFKNRNKPKHALGGISTGATQLGKSVASAISGVVVSTYIKKSLILQKHWFNHLIIFFVKRSNQWMACRKMVLTAS